MRFLACGEHAILVELADLDQVLGRYRALRRHPPPGVGDLVPAARTLLVHFDPTVTDRATVTAAITALAPEGPDPRTQRVVRIPVHYDGADLGRVAELAGLSPAAVVRAHTGAELLAAFGGFAPGFCYLIGLPKELCLPRRDTPRTRVPAGAVALGGGYTAVYPRQSPGGWQLIGHTELSMWDLTRDPPATLLPGDRVRFTEAGS